MMATEWSELASCRDLPLAESERMFFTRGTVAVVTRKLCQDCLVRAECLAAADAEEAGLGITKINGFRGGLTAAERLKRRQAVSA